jgi:hypothetical protein
VVGFIAAFIMLTVIPSYSAYANDTTALAAGDVAIDGSSFPDPAFLRWAQEQPWAEDGILSSAEASVVKTIVLYRAGVEFVTESLYLFPELEGLNCVDNYVTALDLSNNPKLKWVNCGLNDGLTSLNVSNNPLLESIDCYGDNLSALNITQNPKLESLICANNSITQLDVSYNPALASLDCYNNRLSGIDVTHNPELIKLDCSGNRLTELDVSRNTKLTFLFCGANEIEHLDISGNIDLVSLIVSSNNLVTLDLANNQRLSPMIWQIAYSNQTARAAKFTPDGGSTWYVDLAALVGAGNLGQVTSVTGGSYDGASGLVLLDDGAAASSLVYHYDVGNSYVPELMDVTLNLSDAAAPLVSIRFDSAGGSAVPPMLLPKGGVIVQPQDPVWEGHVFSGWYTMADDGAFFAWDFSNSVSSDMTLFALWDTIDKSALEALVQKVDAAAIGSIYGTTISQNLAEAVSRARAILAHSGASQQEVDAAVKEIEDILDSLGYGSLVPTIFLGNAGASYAHGSGANLVGVIEKDLSLHSGVVQVNGLTISEGKDYTVSGDGTHITLLPSYLDALPAGQHTLTVRFLDGYDVEDSFTIVAGSGTDGRLPKSGDNQGALVFVAPVTVVIGLLLLLAYRFSGQPSRRRP